MTAFCSIFRSIGTFAAALAIAPAAAETNQAAHPSATSLRRPAANPKAPDADGFIQRWLILEPIPSRGLADGAVKAAVRIEYFTNQLSLLPRDGDSVTVGGSNLTWHAVETRNYNVNLYHFAHGLGKRTSDALFWTVTTIDCPEETREVRLAIGSNAASVWWLNGQEVIGIYGDRQCTIDDGVSKRLTLKRGRNVLRGAIINGGGATDFCARFLDVDEKPLTRFTIGNTGEGD